LPLPGEFMYVCAVLLISALYYRRYTIIVLYLPGSRTDNRQVSGPGPVILCEVFGGKGSLAGPGEAGRSKRRPAALSNLGQGALHNLEQPVHAA